MPTRTPARPAGSLTAPGQVSELPRVEPRWRAEAACKDSTAAAFYPPNTTESRQQRQAREGSARAVCARCEVRQPCLEYALYVQEPYGIWGGLNELERRRLLRLRAADA